MQGGAYVFIALCFGLAGGIVGRLKGSSFFLWFLIAGIVPVFGLLAAVFYRNEHTVEQRSCPGCGKVVYIHEALCTRCGTELYYPESEDEIYPAQMPSRHA